MELYERIGIFLCATETGLLREFISIWVADSVMLDPDCSILNETLRGNRYLFLFI